VSVLCQTGERREQEGGADLGHGDADVVAALHDGQQPALGSKLGGADAVGRQIPPCGGKGGAQAGHGGEQTADREGEAEQKLAAERPAAGLALQLAPVRLLVREALGIATPPRPRQLGGVQVEIPPLLEALVDLPALLDSSLSSNVRFRAEWMPSRGIAGCVP